MEGKSVRVAGTGCSAKSLWYTFILHKHPISYKLGVSRSSCLSEMDGISLRKMPFEPHEWTFKLVSL